jgi:hypothetical protein
MPNGEDAAGAEQTDWRRVADVAAALRGVWIWFFVYHLCLLIALILIEPFSIRMIATGGTVLSFGLLLSFAYQLVTGIDDSAPYLWIGLMAPPCVNVVGLMVLNSKGLVWLEAHDLELGLVGPTKNAVAQLQERATAQEIEQSAQEPGFNE